MMKNFKLISRLMACVIFCIVLSVALSGCALFKLTKPVKVEPLSATDVSSNTESVDNTPTISEEEYEFLDSVARALYYAKFQSKEKLNDTIVLEYISAILHDQDLIQKDYLVTPEKTNMEYKLEVSLCKKIAKSLFGYELGETKAVGGKFIFPYAGGVTPKVAGRDTHPLEDGSFIIIYTILAEGVDGEYIINNQVTLNVIRQNDQYSKFRIISIVSADG